MAWAQYSLFKYLDPLGLTFGSQKQVCGSTCACEKANPRWSDYPNLKALGHSYEALPSPKLTWKLIEGPI